MIMQIIRLQTNLSEEELLKRAREREPRFKAIPGLLQKYYVKLVKPRQFGGIYIWDSHESLDTFRSSELAASFPKAYAATETPEIEVIDVLFQLRE
jgi:heme-degrading monooxygenase HmoA